MKIRVLQLIVAVFLLVGISTRGWCLAVDGACGSSGNGLFTAVPTSNLCSTGTASTVTGTGPWDWTCNGSNGGSNASCSAQYLDVNYPKNCAQVQTINSTAGDGEYTITPVTGQSFSVYCYGMQTGAPKEYLSLVKTGGSYNFSQLSNLNNQPNSAIRTSFTKIRLDPATLLVDINDFTFSSTTSTNTTDTGLQAYGVAADCLYSGTPTGTGNIDLTGTPFIVNSKFILDGWNAYGSATVDGNLLQNTVGTGSAPVRGDWVFVAGKVVDLKGGGFAGAIGPEGPTGSTDPLYKYFGAWVHDLKPLSTPILKLSLSSLDGSCGSATGTGSTTIPTTNLCAAGTASAVAGTGPWNWTCSGSNGGSSVNCSASYSNIAMQSVSLRFGLGISDVTINNMKIYFSACSNNCSYVYGNIYHVGNTAPSSIYELRNYTYARSDVPTGNPVVNQGEYVAITNANGLYALLNIIDSKSFSHGDAYSGIDFAYWTFSDGICGLANGTIVQTVPSANLCANGTASAITGSTALSWNCAGSNGGTNATCSATLVDTTPPTLTVSTLSSGAATNQTPLNITGTVTDANGVASLTINGNAVTVSSSGAFSYALPLTTTGSVPINIVATDNAGNATTDTRNITYDTTLPVITITAPADNSQTKNTLVTVSGNISEAGTVQARINSGSWQAALMNGTAFTAQLSLASGLNTIEVTATDQAGNTAVSVKRSVLYDPNSPALAITLPSRDILINTSSVTVSGTVSDATSTNVILALNNTTYPQTVTSGSFSQTFTLPAEGSYAVTATATDAVGNPPSTVTRNIIYTPYPGDSNADGATTSLVEVLKAYRYTKGLTTLTAVEKLRLDCAPLGPDGKPQPNGIIDTADVILLMRRLVGLTSW